MKVIIAFGCGMILSCAALAQRTVLANGAGSVQLPPGYISVDMPGGILRPKDAKNAVFTKGDERIDFLTEDEGTLCVSAEKYFPEKKKILSKWTSENDGHKVSVIVYEHKDNPGRGGAIVSYPDLKVDFACDYLHGGHLANFLYVALTYKPVEQEVGAGQPATRPVVGPEGGDKPRPESEGRSR